MGLGGQGGLFGGGSAWAESWRMRKEGGTEEGRDKRREREGETERQKVGKTESEEKSLREGARNERGRWISR